MKTSSKPLIYLWNMLVLLEVLKKYRKLKFKDWKTKNRIMMILSNSKKSRFIKEQEVTALLSNLRIKTPLSKISLSRSYFVLGY